MGVQEVTLELKSAGGVGIKLCERRETFQVEEATCRKALCWEGVRHI